MSHLHAKDGRIPSRFSILHVVRSKFDLSAQELKDGFVLYYKKPSYLGLLCVVVVDGHLDI